MTRWQWLVYMYTGFTTKFRLWGGLHEKHVVANWHLGDHLSICSWTQGNQEKPVLRWPVAGPSGPCPLDSSPATNVIIVKNFDNIKMHGTTVRGEKNFPACRVGRSVLSL